MIIIKRIATALICSFIAVPSLAQTPPTPSFAQGLINSTIRANGIGGISGPALNGVLTTMLSASTGYVGSRLVIAPEIILGSTSAATTNAVNINVAIQTVAAAGGGTVELPCGDIYVASVIDNNVQGVLVTGCRRTSWSDGGSNQTYGTRLIATAAMSSVLNHRTPSSTTTVKFKGGGFTNLMVEGNDLAQSDLVVQTVSYAQYDLYLHGAVGNTAAYFKAGVSGTDTAPGEAADIQHSHINLSIREGDDIASAGTWGLVLDGSINANTSFNDVWLDAQVKNGTVIGLNNADNNDIHLVDGHRFPGGTGGLISVQGISASSPFGGKQNIFYHVTGTPADGSPMTIYAQGTDTSGVTSGITNQILDLDVGNGTALPTQGTGSSWEYYNNLTNNYEVTNLTSSNAVIDKVTNMTPQTVASLNATWPCSSGTEGSLASVTDATTTTLGTVVTTGGGSSHVLLYCNGTNYSVH